MRSMGPRGGDWHRSRHSVAMVVLGLGPQGIVADGAAPTSTTPDTIGRVGLPALIGEHRDRHDEDDATRRTQWLECERAR